MTDKEFFDKAIEVSTEFDRLVLAHEEIAEKVPNNALVIFEIEDDVEFTAKSKEIALLRKEPGQPIVLVKAKRLLPPLESRLLNAKVELVSNLS